LMADRSRSDDAAVYLTPRCLDEETLRCVQGRESCKRAVR
jgi:hypothetical protein